MSGFPISLRYIIKYILKSPLDIFPFVPGTSFGSVEQQTIRHSTTIAPSAFFHPGLAPALAVLSGKQSAFNHNIKSVNTNHNIKETEGTKSTPHAKPQSSHRRITYFLPPTCGKHPNKSIMKSIKK